MRSRTYHIISTIMIVLFQHTIVCTGQYNNNDNDYNDNYYNDQQGGGGDYYDGGAAAGGGGDDYYYNGSGGGNDVDDYNTGDGVDGSYYGAANGDEGLGSDNLYANYAEHQQQKVIGGVGGSTGGVGYITFVAGCGLSWFLGGKYHSSRVSKALKTKFQKEQKQLYTQYYNDVYKLSEQNAELSSYVETLKEALKSTEAKHELETIQREYDEFKQPDIDGDDRISRAEFNMYVKNYLSNYPGLTEADYPKFEDFDHDHDGYVSFQEYAQQMALQAQQAELDQMYGKDKKKAADKKAALDGLYESSVGSARTKMYR